MPPKTKSRTPKKPVAPKLTQREILLNQRETLLDQHQAQLDLREALLNQRQNQLDGWQDTVKKTKNKTRALQDELWLSRITSEEDKTAMQLLEDDHAALRKKLRLQEQSLMKANADSGQLREVQHKLSVLKKNLLDSETLRQQQGTTLSEVQDLLIDRENALRQRDHERDQTVLELKALADQTARDRDELEQRHAQALAAIEAELSQKLDTSLEELAAASDLLNASNAERAKLESQHAQEAAETTKLSQKLDTSFEELAIVSDLLNTSDAERNELTTLVTAIGNGSANDNALPDQIQRLIGAMMAAARRRYLPPKVILGRQVALLRASGIFDAEWYQSHYQDVPQAALSPEVHFIVYGNAEARAPNRLVTQLRAWVVASQG